MAASKTPDTVQISETVIALLTTERDRLQGKGERQMVVAKATLEAAKSVAEAVEQLSPEPQPTLL